jgi:apolipoprotein N-acyltransferase
VLAVAAHNWYPAVLGPALGYPLMIAVGVWYSALLAWGVGLQRRLNGVLALLAIPILWSALEFVKYVAPVVEDWWFVTLATSQWRFPPALQVLSLTGFPGLSFMLLLANVAIAATAVHVLQRRRVYWPGIGALACVAALIAWGAALLPEAPASQFTVAATEDLANVDPAIRSLSASFTGVEGPYADTPEVSQALFDVNAGLTREVAGEGVAFAVWPENEFADADDPQFTRQLGQLAIESGSYIIADMVWRTSGGLYDTAVMMGPDGQEAGRRAKINITRTEEEYGFVAGPETFSVFDTPHGKVGLGVCWDRHRLWIVHELARAGAQIVLMPVDDDFRNRWFPAHHAADSVFRAVENRVAFVTGSTSGLSQVIDPYGRITSEGDLYRRSAITGQVFTVEDRPPYTRFGDWFGWLMVIGLVALVWRAARLIPRAAKSRPGQTPDAPKERRDDSWSA